MMLTVKTNVSQSVQIQNLLQTLAPYPGGTLTEKSSEVDCLCNKELPLSKINKSLTRSQV